jgi:hypothetical protein
MLPPGIIELYNGSMFHNPIVRVCLIHSFLFFNFVRLVDHPLEALTRFGYRSNKKVEIHWNHIIFWWDVKTHCLNWVTSNCFSLEYGDFNVSFFPKKHVYLIWNLLFLVAKWHKFITNNPWSHYIGTFKNLA